jgi:hypothetical protein
MKIERFFQILNNIESCGTCKYFRTNGETYKKSTDSEVIDAMKVSGYCGRFPPVVVKSVKGDYREDAKWGQPPIDIVVSQWVSDGEERNESVIDDGFTFFEETPWCGEYQKTEQPHDYFDCDLEMTRYLKRDDIEDV